MRYRLISLGICWFCWAFGAVGDVLQPVEELGGHPVYGEAMPREGVVRELRSVFADPENIATGEGKYAGAIHKVCVEDPCVLILSAGDELVRVRFADEALRVPADSAGSALVWGALEANAGAGYRLTARSILVKTATPPGSG